MTELKSIEPYVRGQIVGYVERPKLYCSSGGDWYVVNTSPRHEVLAKGEIAQIGMVVYLPIILNRENGGRRLRMVERPMFPNYLFVRCESRAEWWGKVASARGVFCILGAREHPQPIADGVIDAIRLHEAEEAEKAQKQRHTRKSGIIWQFKPEDIIRIKSGPFQGFYAELKSAVDKHDRVRALF